MSKSNTWVEADMRRALKIAEEKGLEVAGIEIERHCARILFKVDQPSQVDDAPKPKQW